MNRSKLIIIILTLALAPLARGQTLEVLHSFNNSVGDGSFPHAGLIQGTNGSFYGTTSTGGAIGRGTVF
ncbi:MAG: choice-of-anchor tandem repeat GloVer-containing protein, partial [Verrucomicrobiota bacterium]